MKKALVIDDSIVDRRLITSILSDQGYLFKEAERGEQGIDLALTFKPNIVFIDIILPDMLGTDVLKILNKMDKKKKSSFIMTSAIQDKNVIEDCLQSGAKAYLVKPFSEFQLLKTL